MGLVNISEDGATMTIAYDKVIVPISITYTTEQVEEQLSAWGLARGNMLPPIPEQWTSSQQITDAIRDPKLHLETESLNGDPVLRIRHPHFGWISFVFSRNEAAGLGQALIVRATAEPPAPAGRA
jgi:hypothetical protein